MREKIYPIVICDNCGEEFEFKNFTRSLKDMTNHGQCSHLRLALSSYIAQRYYIKFKACIHVI